MQFRHVKEEFQQDFELFLQTLNGDYDTHIKILLPPSPEPPIEDNSDVNESADESVSNNELDQEQIAPSEDSPIDKPDTPLAEETAASHLPSTDASQRPPSVRLETMEVNHSSRRSSTSTGASTSRSSKHDNLSSPARSSASTPKPSSPPQPKFILQLRQEVVQFEQFRERIAALHELATSCYSDAIKYKRCLNKDLSVTTTSMQALKKGL